jgi:hypothetical protein
VGAQGVARLVLEDAHASGLHGLMEQDRAGSLSLVSVIEISGSLPRRHGCFDSGATHGSRMGVRCIEDDANTTDAGAAVLGPPHVRCTRARAGAKTVLWWVGTVAGTGTGSGRRDGGDFASDVAAASHPLPTAGQPSSSGWMDACARFLSLSLAQPTSRWWPPGLVVPRRAREKK